jgi:hypothetical protein
MIQFVSTILQGRDYKMDVIKFKLLFENYKTVEYHKSPNYGMLFNKPLCSTTILYEEEETMYNTSFRDLEENTYFYDFSFASFEKIVENGLYEFLVESHSGKNKTPLGEKLGQLIQSGKEISHIVRSKEEYGGDTHYSVWRDYLKVNIYEVNNKAHKALKKLT